MPDRFHITTDDMRALRALLREITGLVEDLAIALTRQARISAGPRVDSGTDEQPIPYDIGASDAHELLHQTLTAWANLVHTAAFTHPRHFIGPLQPGERRQPPAPGSTTIHLARWLERNVTNLARIPGAEDAYDEIDHAMQQCRRACDQHDDTAVIPIDDARLAEAREQEYNARGCAHAAQAAGISITQRRVKHLAETGAVSEVGRTPAGARLFRLGDVLDAHERLAALERIDA